MKGPMFSSSTSSWPISRATVPATLVNPFQVPDVVSMDGVWLDDED